MGAIGTCWALLLMLAMFPLQTIAGRQLSGFSSTGSERQQLEAASPEILGQTPPQVKVPAAPTTHGGSREKLGGSVLEDDAQFQERIPPPHRKMSRQGKSFKQVKREHHGESIYGHRLLVGSSAPTCQGKCGKCNPCSPIHMAVGSPHGALTQQEYYPEVWRCKCGGVYFMP